MRRCPAAASALVASQKRGPSSLCPPGARTRHTPQDPDDKSFILADEALQALTGESRFKGFGFSKLIKQHFTGYA